MDPRGEGLSLLHYQFSTLQFILGKLEDAQKLAQQSYDLALHTYKAESDQASPQHALPAEALACPWHKYSSSRGLRCHPVPLLDHLCCS